MSRLESRSFDHVPRRQRLDQRQPPLSRLVSGHPPPPATWAPAPAPHQRPESSLYESDEFRMYEFKITPCPRTRQHNWTKCPYAHKGERARRRDLERFNYVAIACPEFKACQQCSYGDWCIFTHSVFEYWLHPARYRTRACMAGKSCSRRVCFFAHGPTELRPLTWYRIIDETTEVRGDRGGGEKEEAGTREKLESFEGPRKNGEGVKVNEGSSMGFEGDLVDCESEMVDVDWVFDLID